MPWEQVKEIRQAQSAQLKSLADQRQLSSATHSAIDSTEQLIDSVLSAPVALSTEDSAEAIINQALEMPVSRMRTTDIVDPLELASLLSADVAWGFE